MTNAADWEEVGDASAADILEWYFRPAWRSLLPWPLGLFYVGGIVWTFVLGLAINWDIIRWNFLIWLIIGSTVFQLVAFMGLGGYYAGLVWTHALWTSRRLRTWWGLPLQILGSLLLFALAGPVALGLSGWVIETAAGQLNIEWGATGAVLDFVTSLHIW